MAFNFGDPNLFVMGMVDQTLYDRNSGDVIGFDRLPNDIAVNYTFEFTDITGFQNSLVMSIPHTTRLTGTYTSAAFSLQQRALLSGGELSYNGIARVCESITATANTLTVTQTPSKFYAQPSSDTTAWCYVREQGAKTYQGTNYGVDLTTREVQNFTATVGTTYEVTYFTAVPSAQALGLPSTANPSVVTIVQKWGVYAAQNGSRKHGTLQGYLYFTVPLAMLEGDAGINGNQTTNATTLYNWRAFSPTDNIPVCDSCTAANEYGAYYVYVPCDDAKSAVSALIVVGGGVSVAVNGTAQIPVKYLMPDDSIVQPVFSDMQYSIPSSDATIATVSPSGIVTGKAAGDTEVTITLTKADGSKLTTYCNVTVVAA